MGLAAIYPSFHLRHPPESGASVHLVFFVSISGLVAHPSCARSVMREILIQDHVQYLLLATLVICRDKNKDIFAHHHCGSAEVFKDTKTVQFLAQFGMVNLSEIPSGYDHKAGRSQ